MEIARNCGNKAENLIKLKRGGFKVPPFFIVNHLDIDDIKEVAKKIETKLQNKKYIIRSSANVEDSSDHSFAGIFESEEISKKEDIIPALKKILKTNTNKINSYLKAKSIKKEPKISLIIQEFIEGDYSGVIFTQAPSYQKEGILINYSRGGARQVVEGKKSREIFVPYGGKYPRRFSSLIKTAREIEKMFKTPQDIEWTIKNNQIYILQSRNITKSIPEELELWDNSNIAESYSGVTLPMTQSYLRFAYKMTYIDVARRSGVSRRKISENLSIFENLLGFFDGHVYYNMMNWYKMLTLFPGYEKNKENFEDMISARSRETLNKAYQQNVTTLFKIRYYIKFLSRMPFFNREVKGFKKKTQEEIESFDRIDLDNLTEFEIINLYKKYVISLLYRWGITVENDFLLMTYYGKLKRKNKGKIPPLSNIKDLISARQVTELVRISRLVNSNAPHLVIDKVIDEYKKRYSSRIANELKLETEVNDQKKEEIIRIARLYDSHKEKTRPFKKIRDNKLINKIKHYTKEREELRLIRAQAFNIARKIFLELGKRKLRNKRDVFYLTIEEILRDNDNLEEIVKRRKREYQKYKDTELENIFYTNSAGEIIQKETKTNSEELLGVGCSAGIVHGKVTVLENFRYPQRGETFEIIVTKHTDPGWTPLFGLCKGLVVENGGLLSHAAIVARELNLPCVIGIKNATIKLNDGDEITLNGYTGEISKKDKIDIIEYTHEKRYVEDYINLLKQFYPSSDEQIRIIAKTISKKNPSYKYCKVKNWIAYENKKAVGHISSIVDKRQKGIGIIGFYECSEDKILSKKLISIAEDFLKKCGCKRIIGPINLTIWHTYRFTKNQIKTQIFPQEPVTKKYYIEQFKEVGFNIFEEYLSAERKDFDTILKHTKKSYEEALTKEYKFRLVNVETIDKDFSSIYKLSKKIFRKSKGFVPISEEEYNYIYDEYKRKTNDIIIQIISKENKDIGFCSSRLDGENVILKTIGILPEYQGEKLGSALLYQQHKIAIERGAKKEIYALIQKENNVTKMPFPGVKVIREYVLLEKEIN